MEDKYYYFQENGRAATNTFLKIKGKLYHFGKKSTLTTGGWFCVDDGYYYAGKKGVLATNTVIEGYKLDENGKCPTKYQVKKLVKKVTKSDMSDQEKIKAIYNWLLTNDMNYIRTYEHVKKNWVWKDSWVDDMAASIIEKWGGNCYRYASLSGMMFREATGLPVTVYHGIQVVGGSTFHHGWVTI